MKKNNPNYPKPASQYPGYENRSASQLGYPPQPGYPSQPGLPTYPAQTKKKSGGCLNAAGCFLIIASTALILLVIGAYFFLPFRTNILILGMDYAEPGSDLARTDTIILTTFLPHKPYIGMLSIPRDLWVNIPGVGENRINTAHFYAEAAQPGTGPQAAEQTVEYNFGVTVHYYVRVRFEGFRDVIDELGGVDLVLSEPMAGYSAGTHHLDGAQALAFVRDRANTDDFYRMQHGQIMLKALAQMLIRPATWSRIPDAIQAGLAATKTNVPIVLWPRLGFSLLRIGTDGVDNRIISRDMVLPFTTNQGAMVLAPQWNLINPLLLEMFGQ